MHRLEPHDLLTAQLIHNTYVHVTQCTCMCQNYVIYMYFNTLVGNNTYNQVPIVLIFDM